MTGYLLGRVLLPVPTGVLHQISAALLTERYLWLAGDEMVGGRIALGRLDSVAPGRFLDYETVAIDAMLDLDTEDGEADIEGLDGEDGCLWLVGSHSRRRKKPRFDKDRNDPQKAIRRLAVVAPQRNRFLLARLPVGEGVPVAHAKRGDKTVTAARLKLGGDGNPLMTALTADPHLKPYVLHPGGDKSIEPAPAKENGFDIEGLAVRGERVYLGLRGPVLVGWAIVIELVIVEKENRDDRLTLAEIAPEGRVLRKHFLDLGGLGVRDLTFDVDGTLLILAGSTMVLNGGAAVFRWQPPKPGADDTITWKDDEKLKPLFVLPLSEGGDQAEALCRFDWGSTPAVMVAYDAPNSARIVEGEGVLADVFRL